MLDKISNLAREAEGDGGAVYEGLMALAKRLEDRLPKDRGYVLLDIAAMESLLDPEKADVETGVERMEMEL